MAARFVKAEIQLMLMELNKGLAMKRNWSQITIMFSGTLLILCGMGLVVFQVVLDQPVTNAPTFAPQSLSASTKGFETSTHYVGLELVIVGAVLQIAGLIGRKGSDKQKD
jgi:hypothetical protein